MRTVLGGHKLFKAGKFSVEDDTRPGRPKTSVTITKTRLFKYIENVTTKNLKVFREKF